MDATLGENPSGGYYLALRRILRVWRGDLRSSRAVRTIYDDKEIGF